MLEHRRTRAGTAHRKHTFRAQVVHEQPLHDPTLAGGENRRLALTRGQRRDVRSAQPVQEIEEVAARGQDTCELRTIAQYTAAERTTQFRSRVAEVVGARAVRKQ